MEADIPLTHTQRYIFKADGVSKPKAYVPVYKFFENIGIMRYACCIYDQVRIRSARFEITPVFTSSTLGNSLTLSCAISRVPPDVDTLDVQSYGSSSFVPLGNLVYNKPYIATVEPTTEQERITYVPTTFQFIPSMVFYPCLLMEIPMPPLSGWYVEV